MVEPKTLEHDEWPVFRTKLTTLYQADCLSWLGSQERESVQGVVTDPPYGMIEYTDEQLAKRRNGRGGIWRIPPSFGGSVRQPLPRFTVLQDKELDGLSSFFTEWATQLKPVLVPGGHVLIATNPLLSDVVASSLRGVGFEKRGEILRLVRTLRGGDRPKGAEEEFSEVSAMPRSNWEPWLLFRRPFDGTLADNLRRWKAGGLRRHPDGGPFPDVIASGTTPKAERKIAPHPSLKPQAFLRDVVRALLPLGEGILLDPFAGSGSTLAASEAVGYRCVGVEKYREYFELATVAIPRLIQIPVGLQQSFSPSLFVDRVTQ